MQDIPLSALFGALAFLLLLSGFFSGSETALMTLNRYRLRHLANAKHPGALLAQKLLDKPDRLIGLILLGNNFVNILASSLATIIAIRLGGEGAIPIAAGLLTLVVLIFSEVAPKTLAALHPERLAFPAAWVYTPLLRIMFPLVWLVNYAANTVLKLLRIYPEDGQNNALSREELRTMVNDGATLPKRHQKMLISILDLEKITVDDIMVPRNEIDGIDLDEPIDTVLEQLENMPYTRTLAYRDSLDNVVGFLHLRRVMRAQLQNELNADAIEALIREPYFIPNGTSLTQQLHNFQRYKRRTALVVDEYGDVQGLVTMADILEEIVGEFATDPADSIADVHPQQDGSFLVDGGANLRDLVRTMHWQLPVDGPKTLNGLIIEFLEDLPETGTSIMINGYPIDVVQTQSNTVKIARVRPAERRIKESNND